VHRDIKPENILLNESHAILADFGIARAIDVAAGDQLTDSQLAIGTPAYMSPEQGTGGDRIGPASDIYSLGIVAYEMLAGGPPFTGRTPLAIQARKVTDRVPPLRTVRATVRPSLEAAIRRALEVTPADRWTSAGSFAKALDADPTPKRLTGRGIAVLIVALLLTAAGLFAWRRNSSATAARNPPRVVVAEFNNLTGDHSLDYLGITAVDWLTEGLQRTGVISGVATESAITASRFVRDSVPTTEDPILSLAKEAGADIVVSGRIYPLHDSLEYQIQVTDAKTRTLLGAIGPVAAPRQDPISGLVEVRTRLMGLLASRVDGRLAQLATGLPGPPTYEAYRDFSLGLERYIRGDFDDAERLFESAYSHDTSFAAPVLFASISLSNEAKYRAADSLLNKLSTQRERLSRMQQVWLDYRRALMAGQRAAALAAIRTLDSLNPGTKATYNHGVEALENGYIDEAIKTLRSLPPERGPMRQWIPYYEVLGSAYHLTGRFSDELELGEDARRRYPDRLYALLPSIRALAALGRISELNAALAGAASLSADPYGTTVASLYIEAADELRSRGDSGAAAGYYVKALNSDAGKDPSGRLQVKAAALRGLGRWKDLSEAAAALVGIDSTNPDYQGLLGTALAHVGKLAEANAIAASLGGDQRPYLFGRPALARARIETALGNTDDALADLRRAFAQGHQFDLWVHRDVDFEKLRPTPQFQSIVAPKHI
ncbi:MAG TPA: serine/threonine-protein kinase, partial [Gemmatimonadaceae bacterium]|nr:serine/threonine-protein kinase [Gemmatimonadaceae bacterium]